MITLKKGNLLDSSAQTLVNTVNCVGIMGKGIALEFKRAYPRMYDDYVQRCNRREVKPGIPYRYREDSGPQIINFPTKNHWRSRSRVAFIEEGLEVLSANYEIWEIESIAIPPLGCGNGGLDWEEIGPLIYRHASKMGVPVEIYLPPEVANDDTELQRISISDTGEQQTQLPLDFGGLTTVGSRRSA